MAPTKNLGGIGLAVSNMARSVAFYRDILGYVPTQTFDVQDFTETILAFPAAADSSASPNPIAGGAQLILMQYKHAPAPARQLGKLVWYVRDDAELAEIMRKCKAHGCRTYKKLGVGEGWIRDIGMVYDLDGFLLEFLPLRLQGGLLGDQAKI